MTGSNWVEVQANKGSKDTGVILFVVVGFVNVSKQRQTVDGIVDVAKQGQQETGH